MMTFNDYFASIPILETKRCILRPFSRDDLEEYFMILRDERVQKYLAGGIPLYDKEPHTTNWLNNINRRLLDKKLVLTWCIEDKETHHIVGRIDLGGFNKKQVAEIAYHLGYDYWGKGIATEVISRISEFGVNNLKLKRIQATVMVDNLASIKALEKCGYIKEGILHYYPIGKEFHDVVMLALLNLT